MPFDSVLATRVREQLKHHRGFVEKRMFGGLAFLLHGHLCVAVSKDSLIARVGPDAHEAAQCELGANEFKVSGKAFRGWARVDPVGVEFKPDLARWLEWSVTFVKTLPPKKTPPGRTAARGKSTGRD